MLQHQQWQNLYAFGIALSGDCKQSLALLKSAIERLLLRPNSKQLCSESYLRQLMRNIYTSQPHQAQSAVLNAGTLSTQINADVKQLSTLTTLAQHPLSAAAAAEFWQGLEVSGKDLLYLWAVVELQEQPMALEMQIAASTFNQLVTKLQHKLAVVIEAQQTPTTAESTMPLNIAVNRLLTSKTLTDANIADLNTKIMSNEPHQGTAKKRLNRISHIAIALLLLGLALLAESQWQQWQRQQLLQLIADDAVAAFAQRDRLDSHSASLKQIALDLSELGFPLYPSIHIADFKQRLQGARYSQLAKNSAVLLQLSNAQQNAVLIEAAFNLDSFGRLADLDIDSRPAIVFARGLQVSIWKEKDALMVLVEDIDQGAEKLTITPPQINLDDR